MPKLLVREWLREHLEIVARSSKRAANLTGQLLAFGRRQALKTEQIDLRPFLQGLVSMLQRLVGPDVGLAVDLGDDPLPILFDQTQLEQVVVNLVINGRDAMPSGGRIRLEARRVEAQGLLADDGAAGPVPLDQLAVAVEAGQPSAVGAEGHAPHLAGMAA